MHYKIYEYNGGDLEGASGESDVLNVEESEECRVLADYSVGSPSGSDMEYLSDRSKVYLILKDDLLFIVGKSSALSFNEIERSLRGSIDISEFFLGVDQKWDLLYNADSTFPGSIELSSGEEVLDRARDRDVSVDDIIEEVEYNEEVYGMEIEYDGVTFRYDYNESERFQNPFFLNDDDKSVEETTRVLFDVVNEVR